MNGCNSCWGYHSWIPGLVRFTLFGLCDWLSHIFTDYYLLIEWCIMNEHIISIEIHEQNIIQSPWTNSIEKYWVYWSIHSHATSIKMLQQFQLHVKAFDIALCYMPLTRLRSTTNVPYYFCQSLLRTSTVFLPHLFSCRLILYPNVRCSVSSLLIARQSFVYLDSPSSSFFLHTMHWS